MSGGEEGQKKAVSWENFDHGTGLQYPRSSRRINHLRLTGRIDEASDTEVDSEDERTHAHRWQTCFMSDNETEDDEDVDKNRPCSPTGDNEDSPELNDDIGATPQLEIEGDTNQDEELENACQPSAEVRLNPYVEITAPCLTQSMRDAYTPAARVGAERYLRPLVEHPQFSTPDQVRKRPRESLGLAGGITKSVREDSAVTEGNNTNPLTPMPAGRPVSIAPSCGTSYGGGRRGARGRTVPTRGSSNTKKQPIARHAEK